MGSKGEEIKEFFFFFLVPLKWVNTKTKVKSKPSVL